MIKAIIFDCFGVLVTEAWGPFSETAFEKGTETYKEAVDAMKAANLGFTSHSEFRSRLSQLSGLSLNEVSARLDGSVLDERMLELIRRYKPKYKVGMLSNISPDRLQTFFSPEQLALFDALALSYEIRVMKPYPEAYEIAAAKLGVLPEECIFVDDIERNTTAAEELGMKAIVFKDFTQFEQELAGLLQ